MSLRQRSIIPRYYFAHPVNAYPSPHMAKVEERVIRLIMDSFSEPILFENPSQLHHQINYAKSKNAGGGRDGHKAMNYYFDIVLPDCDGAIVMPFLDGKFGLGVGGEARWFLQADLPVRILAVTQEPTPENFAQFVKLYLSGLFRLREATDEEKLLFMREGTKDYPDAERELVLGLDATRVRTFADHYNGALRPYELAHLAPLTAPPGFYPDKA